MEQLARRAAARRVLQLVDHLVLGHAEQAVQVQLAVQQVERPLKHGRRRADAVVPVDFAEHDVARENHQFGGGLALVGNANPSPASFRQRLPKSRCWSKCRP